MSNNTEQTDDGSIETQLSDGDTPPSPYRSLKLSQGLLGSFDPDHCERCGQPIEDASGGCPALDPDDERGCRP